MSATASNEQRVMRLVFLSCLLFLSLAPQQTSALGNLNLLNFPSPFGNDYAYDDAQYYLEEGSRLGQYPLNYHSQKQVVHSLIRVSTSLAVVSDVRPRPIEGIYPTKKITLNCVINA